MGPQTDTLLVNSQPDSAVHGRQFLLRVVSAGESSMLASEVPVTAAVTMGRDPSCDIVLAGTEVSRKHARVSPLAHGLEVTDLGSGNGIWVDEERVPSALLTPGSRVRVGSTVFECAAVDGAGSPLASDTPDEELAEGLAIAVLVGGERVPAGQRFLVPKRTLTVGRAKECDVVLAEADISRSHARIDMVPGGCRVTDLKSSSGTWVGSESVSELIVRFGEPVRLGMQVEITMHPDPPLATRAAPAREDGVPAARSGRGGVEEDATQFLALPVAAPATASATPAAASALAAADAPVDDGTMMISADALGLLREDLRPPGEDAHDATIMVPLPAPAAIRPAAVVPAALPVSRGIETEGERLEPSAQAPFMVDDPTVAYYVVSGGLLVFGVALDQGRPAGPRTHVFDVGEKQLCYGVDTNTYTPGSGLLAVCKPGSVLRRIPVGRLREIAGDRQHAPVIAELLDAWVSTISRAVVRALQTKRSDEIEIAASVPVQLGPELKATSAAGVVWFDLWSGSVLFDGLTTPTFGHKRVLFPLTPWSWIQPLSDEFGTLDIVPVGTQAALRRDELWLGLGVLQQVFCENEFLLQKFSTGDEYVRLIQKREYGVAAEVAGRDAIGSVMRSEPDTPQSFLQAAALEPVLAACTLVGTAQGIAITSHLEGTDELAYEDMINAIASSSNVRTRVVGLRDDWYRRDQGPMVAQHADTKQPIALLPVSSTAYEAISAKTGARARVTEQVAATLAPFAYTFYRPLPDGAMSAMMLIKFGARRLRTDLITLVGMALILGVLGTVTPYFTGQLFDTAIPQAERALLYTYGLALFGAAIATSLFKLTQGIATIRVQSRMESTIQASVWDRLLNLPVGFFRTYPAGDLTDRANGVSAIQELVSGAGVAAILGSISGLFYVVQMFTYDTTLAVLAVVLTFTYVGVTTSLNYLQLRFQRSELEMRGRISGLVLNLIGGVSKLRVCGAERHAFRVWALQFADQRKITFKVGNIQTAAMTFSTSFPLLSSIFIFMVMISAQEAEGGATMTVGDFIAFNAAYALFLAAMQALGDASLSLLRIVPIYERLAPVITTIAEVDKSKAYPGKLKGDIELSRLHFRYTSDGPWIVKDLSLKIKAGEFVAFVGGSGCGKSTLMRLMLGFEKPASGSLYYDGQDLSALDLRLLRQQMGVVLQVSRVMPTDMWRNITGATSRSLEDAWRAAENAGLAEDIRNMPMGMHTYVSEGGGTLSGGQRQRLMIARAIVNQPKILFLDEATSALDNRTQAIVTESMNKMDATRIVIAHRLSTIIDADRICYMEGGQIIEMGSYHELMALNGKFADLARRQVV